MPQSLLKVSQRFEKYIVGILRSLNMQSSAYYLLESGSLAYSLTLKMELDCPFQMPLHFEQSILCYNPEDRTQ
jgi:hypothetical protein